MLHSQKFNRFVTKKPNAVELYVSRNMVAKIQDPRNATLMTQTCTHSRPL